jgi:hypothetical protein
MNYLSRKLTMPRLILPAPAVPARVCCLTYALDTGQTAGIWGGYDENERRLMRQGLRRSALTRGPA